MKDKLKVGYLVTGRLKSTRLPRKLLLEIKGKPVISHMIDRIKLAKNVDEIIINEENFSMVETVPMKLGIH